MLQKIKIIVNYFIKLENLIDNMKNENTNLNKDEYLVVNYDKIMDYIWINQFKLNENYFYILYIYLIVIIFHIKLN